MAEHVLVFLLPLLLLFRSRCSFLEIFSLLSFFFFVVVVVVAVVVINNNRDCDEIILKQNMRVYIYIYIYYFNDIIMIIDYMMNDDL